MIVSIPIGILLATFAISGYLIGMISGKGFDVMSGIALAAMLFGFSLFEKVITFNIFGDGPGTILFWTVKIIVSVIIGVIAFPIMNIYYIVCIVNGIIRRMKNK